MFGRKWEYGQARIVARQHHPSTQPRVMRYDYVADVTPDEGQAAFRATFTSRFDSVDDWDVIPAVGEDVRVRFRPGGEHVNVDPDTLRARANEIKDAAKQQFADAAAGAPASPTPAAQPHTTVVQNGPAVVRVTTSTDPADVERMRERLAAARAAAAPAAAADPAAKLRELGELHASGVLSDAEFESAKARVLGDL